MEVSNENEYKFRQIAVISYNEFKILYLDPIIEPLSLLDDDIKQLLISNNTIFHYTTLCSAKKILNSKSLKFGKIGSAYDFLENRIYFGHFAVYGESNSEVSVIRKELTESFENYKQLCFCTNILTTMLGDQFGLSFLFDPTHHIRESIIPPYHYHTLPIGGFNKNRMWEQYADKGKGVCFIFDNSKLPFKTKNNIDVNKEQIKYILDFGKNANVSLVAHNNKIQNTNEYILANLNKKHFDYRDENELKFIINSENEEFIDINGALIGIIFGPNCKKEELAGLYEELDLVLKLFISNDKNQYLIYDKHTQ